MIAVLGGAALLVGGGAVACSSTTVKIISGDGGAGGGGAEGGGGLIGTPAEDADGGGGGGQDGGGGGGALPAQGVWTAACMTTLSGGRIDRLFRFYAETSSANGKLTMSLTPLRVGTGGTAPSPFSSGDKVGETVMVQSTPLSAKGNFTAPLGEVFIPGEANPVTGGEVVIQNASLLGRATSTRFCARLSGQVSQPIAVELDPTKNTCVWKVAVEGQSPPSFTEADFAAGCAVD